MKYLVIYAHPNPQSFNHAILETVTGVLEAKNCDHTVRDIYSDPFDPVLKEEDLKDLASGEYAQDIKTEQKLISSSDRMIFIHPVWWFSMPAALKGYLDRVFAAGFAFLPTEEGVKGLLKSKSAVSFNTTGATEATYERYGYRDCFRKNICQGIYSFCGLEVIGQHFLYAVAAKTHDERKEMLEKVRKIMEDEVIAR